MQVRCRGVAGTPDVPDDFPFANFLALMQVLRVVIQVAVKEAVFLAAVKKVNRDTARPAAKQFADDSVGYGHYGRAARPQQVDGLVPMASPPVIKLAAQFLRFEF